MIRSLRRRPLLLLVASSGAALGGLALVAWAAGFRAVGDAFAGIRPGWLALVFAAQVVALGAYVLAYRSAARIHDGPALPWSLTARIVAAGFGPFAARGGFALDQRALYALADDGHGRPATVRVLGLGALEYALLAPTACICALVALGEMGRVPLGFSIPWAVAVPLGLGLAVWAARPDRRRRLERGGETRPRRWLGTALEGVDVLRRLVSGPWTCRAAFVGVALYWAADVASFYGGLRAVGAHLGFPALVLAYASGYAATRRTLPLAGAGVTELLLAYFTSLMHVAFGAAVAGVAIYRFANLVVPALPALEAWPRVIPLVEAAEEGEPPSREPPVRREPAPAR